MKLSMDVNNLGISIGLQTSTLEAKLQGTPNQTAPVGYYVYGHYSVDGQLFYVGKGTGRRAWSADRHPLWDRYVNSRLLGKYCVRILVDGLSAEQAEELEAEVIAKNSDVLVNLQNMGRPTDFQLLDRYHALRNANRRLIQETKIIESVDLNSAIESYQKAIEKIAEYAFLDFERGLVGQLLREEADELGRAGEIEALDRMTRCLVKAGRVSEAEAQMATYFGRYKRDLSLKSSEKIKKRIEKCIKAVQSGK